MMPQYWTNGVSTLYQADARALPLSDKSVHCVVTSPPYWGLRDYGIGQWQGGDAECTHDRDHDHEVSLRTSTINYARSTGHAEEPWPGGVCGLCGAVNTPTGIGLEPTLGEWVANIVTVMREVRRVLRDDGTVFLNLGDSYANDTKWGGATGGKHVNGLHGQTSIGRTKTKTGLPPKNLIGQPWRVAFALLEDGWTLRSAIVWAKPNPMPESVTDRPTSAYEMVFLLAKSGTPQFWTHREEPGIRTEPVPDYRWQDRLTGIEHDEEPTNYSEDTMPCPDCGGQGRITIESGQVSLFDGIPSLVKDCTKCKGEGEIKRWKRTNLWQSHDYFYDAEAVRTLGHAPTKMPDGWDTASGAHGSYHRNGREKGRVTDKQRGHSRRHAGFNDRWDAMPKGEQQSNGANARNVWVMATQGKSDAHFATFPDDLPRRCILAATSEKGVCGQCGAPWVRVVDASGGGGNKGCNASIPPGANNPGAYARLGGGTYYASHKTLGWEPTCACDAAVVPATVLDPFVGSGTTCAVAQQLGRRSVGVDLNPEYLDLAVARIAKVPLPLSIM